MILPLMVLAANVAVWYFVNDVRTKGDEGITAIAFAIGLAMLGWLIIETYSLYNAVIAGGSSDRDDD